MNGNKYHPKIGTQESCGYDLIAPCDIFVPPNEIVKIDMQIGFNIPQGYCGFIKDRSSVAYVYQIQTLAGVIDSDFKGSIKVLFHNTTRSSMIIPEGDACCQLVVLPYYRANLKEIKDLGQSDRGEGSFGSTDEPPPMEPDDDDNDVMFLKAVHEMYQKNMY